MSFLKNISIAGAVLGASMMLASSAGAVTVSVIGDLNDDSDNTLLDNSVVDGTQATLDGSMGGSEVLGFGVFAPADGVPTGPGELWFEIKNTSVTENLFFKASANETPNGFVSGFKLTWKNAALGDLISTPIGLPAPNGTTLNITAAIGTIYYLVATWDSAVAEDSGASSFTSPKVFFSVSAAISNEAPSLVPIPPSLVLFGSGLLGLGFLSTRRRRKVTTV